MLGSKMRDVVTGFEGIVIAKVEYLNGCVQYCLKPPVKDGKMIDGEYIDLQQLEVLDGGAVVVPTATGGAMSDTPSSKYAG